MLLFIVAKVLFMCFNGQDHSFSAGDVVDVVWHGLSLDLSTSLYVFIVPFLVSAISIYIGFHRVLRIILTCYFAIIAIALSLAFVADTSLYAFWHFKLDASCLQYLETPTEAMASVSAGYLAVRTILFLVITIGIYLLYRLPLRLLDSQIKQETTRSVLVEAVVYLLAIPPIIIGIRGGLGESTTNIGQVYYSQNQFLNHSAVNPVFSFLSSMGKSGDYIVSYDFFTDEECQQLTDGLYHTDSSESDTLLSTNRPNIVIIVMESCGGQFTAIGGHDDITPTLNRLMHEGVFFSECYANSWRTDKGVVSILSGYPAFPVTSVMKIPEKSRKLPSIASSLQKAGYATSFYYGGDINFTNMRSYVMSSGYGLLKWKADYSNEQQRSAQWGVRDDLMFRSLLDDIKADTATHWMKTLLTLSSHEPWDVPTKQLDDPVYNAFNYLDHCIGQFIDSLRQTALWDNLLLVILPDHGYRYKGINESTRLYNHIPLIWTGGAILKPKTINAVCNQSDLAATLLGQLGLDHDAFTFSRDVVSRQYDRPFAFHTFNNGMTIIDSTGFLCYDLDVQLVTACEGPNTESQLQRARALLQLTSHDLIAK
jgi:phosphoglycerol transferase MdoB-like AlkP superfamily enzyme